MLNVGEVTGSSMYAITEEMQYKSLHCNIRSVEKDSEEWRQLEQQVSGDTSKIKLERLFSLNKASEVENFRKDIPNTKILFHGSKTSHIVGILSRGLLLPKRVVSKGVQRTDYGFLGAGIYFAPDPLTSSIYTNLGRHEVCVSVALSNFLIN